jgi:hypothetical protein
VRCSGEIGCRVFTEDAERWHAEIARRWSDFVEYVRRALPGVTVEYLKTYEPQQRGLLHVHALFRFSGNVTDDAVQAAFEAARSRWGFGPKMVADRVRVGDAGSVRKCARYVAKYVSKTCDELGSMHIDADTGEVSPLHVRPWSASWGFGIRMAWLKESQRVWAVSARALAQPAAAGAAGAVGALDLSCCDISTNHRSDALLMDAGVCL